MLAGNHMLMSSHVFELSSLLCLPYRTCRLFFSGARHSMNVNWTNTTRRMESGDNLPSFDDRLFLYRARDFRRLIAVDMFLSNGTRVLTIESSCWRTERRTDGGRAHAEAHQAPGTHYHYMIRILAHGMHDFSPESNIIWCGMQPRIRINTTIHWRARSCGCLIRPSHIPPVHSLWFSLCALCLGCPTYCGKIHAKHECMCLSPAASHSYVQSHNFIYARAMRIIRRTLRNRIGLILRHGIVWIYYMGHHDFVVYLHSHSSPARHAG